MAHLSVSASRSLNTVLRLIALIILLGVVVYIFLVSTSEDSLGLWEKLSRLSLKDLIIPIALSLTSYLLRFIRWRLILSQLGYQLTAKSDLIFYLSGFALTMTPGKSGETIRSAFLLQAQVPIQVSLSAFIIERSFDLIIVGLIATLLYLPPLVTALLLLVALATVSVLVPLIAPRLVHRAHSNTNAKWSAVLLRLLNVFNQASIALKPKPVALYTLLGGAAWGAQGLGFYFIVTVFTQDIAILNAISTYCAGLVIGAASLIPGGIGVTEGSLSWMLQARGLDQNSALLSALISRGCTLWLAVAIGCAALAAIIKGITMPKNSIPQSTIVTKNKKEVEA